MRPERAVRIPAFAASLLVLAFALFACVQITPPVDPGDFLEVRFSAAQEVSAVQVEIAYDPATSDFAGVLVSADEVLCKSFDDGVGTVTVAFVAVQPKAGDVLSVFFEQASSDVEPVAGTVASQAFAFDEGAVGLTSSSAASPAAVPQPGVCTDDEHELSLSAALASIGTASTPMDLELQPDFANFRLGDVNGDGALDVLDVLRILKIATEAVSAPDDFERYHADLDADASIDTLDVLKVLAKAVDPTVPAEIHVAPRPVSFAHVRSNGPILVNNAGNEPLSGLTTSPSSGVSISQLGGYGISGQSAAYSVNVSGTWRNEAARFSSSTGGAIDVAIGNITILIAGQSNAAGYGEPLEPAEPGIPHVRMFGNDYVWKQAYEPLDDETGQLDSISAEGGFTPDHSFGVKLGKELHAASQDEFDGAGRYVYLIPSARQGSVVHTEWTATWRPDSNRLSRSTLFGSANYRAQASAGTISSPFDPEGGPVSALIWYQGESDAGNSYRPDFTANTNIVMDAFRSELDGVPILYVQLATHTATDTNNRFQSLRERQRLMESGVAPVDTGLGSAQPRSDYHLVVAHDLPMTDSVHLSKEGQLILAERLALAYREHVIGESVDGTGPRLQGISRSGNVIKVDTTHTINDDADYGGYFRVFLASDTSVEYTVSQVRRDPSDTTAVQITLSSTPSDDVRVVYKPPPNRALGVQIDDVVKDPVTGLPLPAFGSLLD